MHFSSLSASAQITLPSIRCLKFNDLPKMRNRKALLLLLLVLLILCFSLFSLLEKVQVQRVSHDFTICASPSPVRGLGIQWDDSFLPFIFKTSFHHKPFENSFFQYLSFTKYYFLHLKASLLKFFRKSL